MRCSLGDEQRKSPQFFDFVPTIFVIAVVRSGRNETYPSDTEAKEMVKSLPRISSRQSLDISLSRRYDTVNSC